MPAFETLSVITLLGIAWLWFDSMQARGIAIQEALFACASDGVQLLDQSVSISKIALDRDEKGQLKMRRCYTFDYSDTGNNRRRGSVVMLGHKVLIVNVGLRLVQESHTLH